MGPEQIASADWALAVLGPGNRFATDEGDFPVLGSYGDQNPVDDVGYLYTSPTFTQAAAQQVQAQSIGYVLVDQRLSEPLPASGQYFPVDPNAGKYTHPLPLADLTKFNHVPGVARIYDSGNIVIYDLRALHTMGRSQADIAATAAGGRSGLRRGRGRCPHRGDDGAGDRAVRRARLSAGPAAARPRIAGLERVAVAAGLALAVPILGGLVLYAAGVPLHRAAWLGLLAGVTLAGDVVLFAAPPGRPGGALPLAPAVARTARACGGLRRRGPDRRRRGGARPDRRGCPAAARFHPAVAVTRSAEAHTLNLGVTNDQGSTTSYRLVLLRNGHVERNLESHPRQRPDLAAVGAVHRQIHAHRRPVPAARP